MENSVDLSILNSIELPSVGNVEELDLKPVEVHSYTFQPVISLKLKSTTFPPSPKSVRDVYDAISVALSTVVHLEADDFEIVSVTTPFGTTS